jgi:DNA-binding transcriptional regulator YhcF (GntR family)
VLESKEVITTIFLNTNLNFSDTNLIFESEGYSFSPSAEHIYKTIEKHFHSLDDKEFTELLNKLSREISKTISETDTKHRYYHCLTSGSVIRPDTTFKKSQQYPDYIREVIEIMRQVGSNRQDILSFIKQYTFLNKRYSDE